MTRTGMFAAAVFVDYARAQARDAVAVAVSHIGAALGTTLIDERAATDALGSTATLLILDNLEALSPAAQRELLDAAVSWSTAGSSRVLCTTRHPSLAHADYASAGTREHRLLRIDGLGSRREPEDALMWFAALSALPPAPAYSPGRDDLIALFDLVHFHPLSIRVLAQLLKARTPAQLGPRLEALLDDTPGGGDDELSPGLLSSLRLSIDLLDDAARRLIPALGVFQGGAFEGVLLQAIELGAAESPAHSTKYPVGWLALRRTLEAAALIEVVAIPGVERPFLRFHPTLAPMLWRRLSEAEQRELTSKHEAAYFDLATVLYHRHERDTREMRAVAWHELPNLLHAVYGALAARAPNAIDFAEKVRRFVSSFGLTREAEALFVEAQAVAAAVAGDAQVRYISAATRGEDLYKSGQTSAAEAVFSALLDELGDAPSAERVTTLCRLSRCFDEGGKLALAEKALRDALDACDRLPAERVARGLRHVLLTDLADVLTSGGRLDEAQATYEAGLALVDEGDVQSRAVTLAQLGGLALQRGRRDEAAERYTAALELCQELRDPEAEASVWHQLGMVYEAGEQWDEAERHYRQAAHIMQELGVLTGPSGAATTWTQLGHVNTAAGKRSAAEAWYRKALAVSADGSLQRATDCHNLASTLLRRPGGLDEARRLAEESYAIKRSLDPEATEVWKTLAVLADIAQADARAATEAQRREALEAEASAYRRRGREATRSLAATHPILRDSLRVIVGAVGAVHHPEVRGDFDTLLSLMEGNGWGTFVVAVRRILAGERDVDSLCAELDFEEAVVVEQILRGVADPSQQATFLEAIDTELPEGADGSEP